MAKKKQIILPAVPIHGIADRGKGVGRTAEGLTVFVEGAVPGDVADVFVQKKKSGFAEGNVERLLTPSPDRTTPFCAHFQICGGCKWQNLDYAAQLKHKHQTVLDAFQRIAKVPVEDFQPILGAPATQYYRNKLEFAFSDRRWLLESELGQFAPEDDRSGLGFHRAGAFDKVVDVTHCWLQADPSNPIRNAAREIARAQGLAFYNIRTHEGFLRNLMLRITDTGETMLLFSFAQPDQEAIDRYLGALLELFRDRITTIVYCVNQKRNDTVFDQEMIVWFGKGYVEERLGDLRFKIGPKSFFQTNSAQAKNLYDTVLEFAELHGTENVYEIGRAHV